MTIPKPLQFLLLAAALALLSIYSFSTGYTAGKDLAAKQARAGVSAR